MPSDEHEQRRAELVTAILDRLGGRSLGDASLRTLAAVAGTSHRMLLYYFGSKEALLDELRLAATTRRLTNVAGLGQGASFEQMLEVIWQETAANAPEMRIGLQLQALAVLDPDAHLERELVHWRMALHATEEALRARGVAEERVPGLATLFGAVMRGLQTDFHLTGDRQRLSAATSEVTRLVEEWVVPASRVPRDPAASAGGPSPTPSRSRGRGRGSAAGPGAA